MLVHEAIKILNRAKGGVSHWCAKCSPVAGSYQAAAELVPLGWYQNDYNNKQVQFALQCVDRMGMADSDPLLAMCLERTNLCMGTSASIA